MTANQKFVSEKIGKIIYSQYTPYHFLFTDASYYVQAKQKKMLLVTNLHNLCEEKYFSSLLFLKTNVWYYFWISKQIRNIAFFSFLVLVTNYVLPNWLRHSILKIFDYEFLCYTDKRKVDTWNCFDLGHKSQILLHTIIETILHIYIYIRLLEK